MQASEAKLQPIIEGAKQYVVPLFQRRYSWEKKEWTALLDDLVELSEDENPRTFYRLNSDDANKFSTGRCE